MNTTSKLAKDIKVGDVIRVSYINRDSKDHFERMTIKLDANGFATRVSTFRERALVGRGVLIMVEKGVFGRVLPDAEVTLATDADIDYTL